MDIRSKGLTPMSKEEAEKTIKTIKKADQEWDYRMVNTSLGFFVISVFDEENKFMGYL